MSSYLGGQYNIYNLVDKKTEGISQIWFISYDPEVFYDYNNVLDFLLEIYFYFYGGGIR